MTFTMNNLKTFRFQTISISILRWGALDFEIHLSAVSLYIYAYLFRIRPNEKNMKNKKIFSLRKRKGVATWEQCTKGFREARKMDNQVRQEEIEFVIAQGRWNTDKYICTYIYIKRKSDTFWSIDSVWHFFIWQSM